MGAWGHGVFENDAACDWLKEVARTADLRFIEATLAQVFDRVEVDTVAWWNDLVDEEKVDTLFAARKRVAP